MLRLLAALITVAGVLVTSYALLEAPNFQYAFQLDTFAGSSAESSMLHDATNWLYQLQYLKNEDYIRSGETIAGSLKSFQVYRQNDYNESVRRINERYAVWISAALQNENSQEAERLTAERDEQVSQQQAGLNRALAERRESLIQQHLNELSWAQQKVTTQSGYLYYVPLEDGGLLANISPGLDVAKFFSGLPASRKSTLSDGNYVYVGLTPEAYAEAAEAFSINRSKGITGVYTAIAGLAMALLGLGYVLYSAGNVQGSAEIRLSLLDRMYLDLGLIVYGGLAYSCVSGLTELPNRYGRTGEVNLVLGALLVTITTLLGLQYLSMVTKRLKRGEFFKHTFFYATLAWALSVVRGVFNATVGRIFRTGSLAVKAVGLLIAFSAVVSVSVLILVHSAFNARQPLPVLFALGLFGTVNIVALMFVASRASELKAIIIGTERIKGGDLSSRIPETGAADFAMLAANVNNIALGLQAAVESEVKSERMKAELVTNVSHDLRTPLTSIITYVDLLKTEGLSSENAPKYLDVLDKKSQRLKVLTEDLFEAAKAASGNVSLKREIIDVGSLLTQGLAELSDRIEGSGLDFRVNIPSDKLHVQADGKLLWRAIENVLSNALNYALVGSRVYIDATARGNQVYLTFKNISASPLNIQPEELVERFKRGDESRTTEGSGLGLAIAKSLLELQGGTFKVDIDGDLFKVTMALPESK